MATEKQARSILPDPDEKRRVLGIKEMERFLTDRYSSGEGLGNIWERVKDSPELAPVPRPAVGKNVVLELKDHQAMIDNAAIFFALQIFKAPIIAGAGQFSIEGSGTDVEQFVREVFKPLARRLCLGSLMAIEFGHTAHEMRWEFDTIETEGGKVPGAWVIKDFVPVKPWLVEYLYDKRTKRVVGFKYKPESQGVATEDEVRVLNGRFSHKAFWFSNEQEYVWDNPYGNPALRRAFKPFIEGENGSLWWDIYMRQKSQPLIVAHAPRGTITLPDKRKLTSAQYLMELIDLQVPRGIITIPQEVAQGEGGKLLWDIKYLMDDRRGDLFRDYSQYWTGHSFMATGNPINTLEGANSISERIRQGNQQKVYEDWLAQVNELIIAPLVLANFGKKESAFLVAKDLTGVREELGRQLVQAFLNTLPRAKREYIMSLLDFEAILDQAGLPRSSKEEIEAISTTFSAAAEGLPLNQSQQNMRARFMDAMEYFVDHMLDEPGQPVKIK